MVTKEHGPNILGRNWLTPLGFRVEGIEEVHHLSSSDELQGDNLNHDFLRLPAVTGVGTGRYNGPPIHRELNPEAPPVYCKARPVPFALKTLVDEAIQRNIDCGKWIPMKYADRWATPIVPVKKKSGSLRLCGDYKGTMNPALSSDSYQTSTTDAVLVDLGSANSVFAEVDLEDAYTQLPVDNVTSRVLAVNTHRGLFRVTTLSFGIKLASSIFQRVVDGVIRGLEGVLAYQEQHLCRCSLQSHAKTTFI